MLRYHNQYLSTSIKKLLSYSNGQNMITTPRSRRDVVKVRFDLHIVAQLKIYLLFSHLKRGVGRRQTAWSDAKVMATRIVKEACKDASVDFWSVWFSLFLEKRATNICKQSVDSLNGWGFAWRHRHNFERKKHFLCARKIILKRKHLSAVAVNVCVL